MIYSNQLDALIREKDVGMISIKKHLSTAILVSVYLRKSQKASPGYKNCGVVTFYKAGTYSFGNVGKGTYWLHIKGGKSNCYKSASGKVQNK